MFKKGQAAMEFLMTYGWAILVVLVAIGALAYFGVLNPSRFLPSSCTIAPGIGCDDFKVSNVGATDTIDLRLRNGMGQDLTIVRIRPDGDCGTTAIATWADGAQVQALSTCGELGTPGARYKGVVNLSYINPSGIVHNISGSITTRIE